MSNPLASGVLKVGQTNNVERRARKLSHGHCFHLRVEKVWPGLGHLEWQVHAELRLLRCSDCPGKEWFRTDLSTVEMCVALMCRIAAQAEEPASVT